jgi:hypothetical protein
MCPMRVMGVMGKWLLCGMFRFRDGFPDLLAEFVDLLIKFLQLCPGEGASRVKFGHHS